MKKSFYIVNESRLADTIACAICVPFFDTDMSQFDSMEEMAAHVVRETQDRLDTQSALVHSFGQEVSSRLTSGDVDTLKDAYESLAPLAQQADTLTLEKLKGGDVPLYEMGARGAATLVNLFISLHVKAIIDMAREYDEDKKIDAVFAREPDRAILRLCSLIKRSCGHAARRIN